MSLQNLATQMAAQGRGPDRTLVHMSPREVHGLQALAMAHGGSLTINPQTGLPEAGFLESILPAVAGFALNAFAPGIGSAVGGLFGLGEAAGTALTVGGIAGLASGSLEKGIMAGMGAYGGASLGGSLGDMGSAVNARAANEAAQVAGLGDAERVAAIQAAAKPDISAGFSAAASNPKDFLQDNKYALGAALLPALAGGFGDDGEGTKATERKKYNMKYARDPVTGALYDTSGEGVTYGGVGRPTIGMAEGGFVDNRSDSEKSYDYLMGVPGAKNPMLFTHESTSAIKPADFGSRPGGKYILDAATNTYVWVPDDTTAADAAAASLAAKQGLAALDRRGGGSDGRSSNPGWDAMTQNEKAAWYAEHPIQAKLENAFLGLFGKQNPNQVFVEDRVATPVAVSNAAAAGLAALSANSQQAADTYSANTQNAVAKNSNVTDPAQMMQAKADAQAQATTAQSIADMAEAEGVALGPAATGGPADGPDGDGPADGSGDPGGPGGECVDPKTHVLLADGSEVQAGSLKVGDVVRTLHEDTFEYGNFEVVYAETIQQPKSIVKFTDGSEITTSLSHKFLLVNREWKRVDALKEGDAIETAPNVNAEGFKVVASLEQIGTGDVVKLTIDQAHTYISDGLVSHNKFARGGSVRQPNFYQNGKFNFHPAQVYGNGGIASLAGGGLGSLGGYSDGGQLLRGPGNGTSDDIPARIGNNQPARLADGEFVVPARIVSELGNGSTDAGARELYKMMARIQAGRAKTVGKNKTAVNSKSARHLPA